MPLVDEEKIKSLLAEGRIDVVYEAYFAGAPPFGAGRKKDEFPGALALFALERMAAHRGIGILAVSKDGDWRAFCEQSNRLFVVPEIEQALDLITKAPIGLREAVHDWLSLGGEGRDQVHQRLASDVEQLEFDANAHPSLGEVEIWTWAGELKDIDWPAKVDLDTIEFEDLESEALRARATPRTRSLVCNRLEVR